jgi:hypothetical protein
VEAFLQGKTKVLKPRQSEMKIEKAELPSQAVIVVLEHAL